MQSGVTLARRFTLVSQEDYDLEGVTRWRARDDRLRKDVTVFTLESDRSSSVLSAVARVSSVRDPRLARVVASGTDAADDAPVAYVVVDRPRGKQLADVRARRDLTPRLAGAIVGSLSRALVPLAGRGIHHGAIRASGVTVSDAGVPLLSGLGIDAALQRGRQEEQTDAPHERSDARALTALYLQCLTGSAVGEVTADDLPEDVPGPARGLCLSLLAGEGPASLSDVVSAFPPDHAALRDFSSSVRALPLRVEVARAELRATVGKPATEVVTPVTRRQAFHAAEISCALRRCAPDLKGDVATGSLTWVSAALPPAPPSAPSPQEIAAAEDERSMFDDLQAYDEMAEVQNAGPSRSVWEALLFRLHSRWPDNETLTRLHDEAHERALKPGPIPTRALLVTAGIGLVIFAVMTALSLLAAPVVVDQDRHNPPSHTYPSYTYGPTASASSE